jgi:excisionase family DNA binding protein
MADHFALPLPPDLVAAIAEQVADRTADRIAAALTARDQVHTRSNGRLALTKAEAAKALGVSVDHLERHVLPDLRVVRSGRLRLVPTVELERWIERNAARVLEAER